jgi:hypothetical protein
VSFVIGVCALVWVAVAMIRFRMMWWRCENNIRVTEAWGPIDTLLQPLFPEAIAEHRPTQFHFCWVACVALTVSIAVCFVFLYA